MAWRFDSSVHPAMLGLALFVSLVGCNSLSPKNESSSAIQLSSAESPGKSALRTFGRGNEDKGLTTQSQDGLSRLMAEKAASQGETPWSVTSFFRKMVDSAKLEPNVEPAADPTKLSSMPSQISPELYLATARLNEERGDFAKALEQYKLAIKSNSKDRKVVLSFAQFQQRLGNFDDAIRLYKRWLRVDPMDALAFNNLGLAYAEQRKLDDAIAALSKAVQLQPNNPRYRNNAASVLVKAGLHNEALEQLYKVYQPSVAHYNIGFLLGQEGRHGEARRYLARAVQMNPNLAVAHDMLRKSTGQQRQVATQPSEEQRNPSNRRIGYSAVIIDRGERDVASLEYRQAADSLPRSSAGSIQIKKLPKPETESAEPAPLPPIELPTSIKNPPKKIGPFGFHAAADNNTKSDVGGENNKQSAPDDATRDVQLRMPLGAAAHSPASVALPPVPAEFSTTRRQGDVRKEQSEVTQ